MSSPNTDPKSLYWFYVNNTGDYVLTQFHTYTVRSSILSKLIGAHCSNIPLIPLKKIYLTRKLPSHSNGGY